MEKYSLVYVRCVAPECYSRFRGGMTVSRFSTLHTFYHKGDGRVRSPPYLSYRRHRCSREQTVGVSTRNVKRLVARLLYGARLLTDRRLSLTNFTAAHCTRCPESSSDYTTYGEVSLAASRRMELYGLCAGRTSQLRITLLQDGLIRPGQSSSQSQKREYKCCTSCS